MAKLAFSTNGPFNYDDATSKMAAKTAQRKEKEGPKIFPNSK